MYSHRQRLPLRLPQQPTAAGYFWIAYFIVLGLLIFG
jgi:hypothetical protein